MSFTPEATDALGYLEQQLSDLIYTPNDLDPAPPPPAPTLDHYGPTWSQVWHDIFGKAAARPAKPALTQAQINAGLKESIGNNIVMLKEAIDLMNALYNDATSAASVGDQQIFLNALAAMAGATGVATAPLQSQIAQVAANAWSNLWALYNNQVVPLVNQAEQTAWGNLWGLWNNQVVPALAQEAAARAAGDTAAAQAAYNTVWSLWNNQVVPALGQLQQGLTAEAARAQQTEATLHNEVTNETARATQAETSIVNSAIPSAVLALRTALQPQIDALKTETDQCLKPLCDTVTPNAKQLGNLGGLLGLLEALGVGTLIGVLIDEMVHHPKQVADEAATIMGDIGRPIFDGARALTNI